MVPKSERSVKVNSTFAYLNPKQGLSLPTQRRKSHQRRQHIVYALLKGSIWTRESGRRFKKTLLLNHHPPPSSHSLIISPKFVHLLFFLCASGLAYQRGEWCVYCSVSMHLFFQFPLTGVLRCSVTFAHYLCYLPYPNITATFLHSWMVSYWTDTTSTRPRSKLSTCSSD